MTVEQDLAKIDAAIIAQRVRHLAASVSEDQGQVVQYPRPVHSSVVTPEQVLTASGYQRVTPASRYTALPTENYENEFPRAQSHSPELWIIITCGAVALTLIGLIVMWAYESLSDAATNPGNALITLVGIGIVIGTITLLTRKPPKDREFSGTFRGRMH